MTLIYLTAASFFTGLGIGYTKFFLLGYLSEHVYDLSAKGWVIQILGAIITIGPAVMFPLAAPLAAAYKKKTVMLFAGLALCLVMLLGAMTAWTGSAWLYALLSGLLLGIFNPARNASVPLQSFSSGKSAECVNAWLNNLYIAGLLAGVPAGTWLYNYGISRGAYPLVLVFVAASICGSRCGFASEAGHLQPFKQSFSTLMAEAKFLLSKYFDFLVPIAVLWGMAGALSLAVTAYAEQRHLAGAVLCSLMSAYAAAGVVVGNALAAPLSNARGRAAVIGAAAQIFIVLAIPAEVEFLPGVLSPIALYWIVSATVLIEGVLFGLTTNLIEAEFFRRVYQEKKEGTGSAVLSALTAFSAFTLGGFIGLAIIQGWLNSVTQFLILSISNVAAAVIIVRLAKSGLSGDKDVVIREAAHGNR